MHRHRESRDYSGAASISITWAMRRRGALKAEESMAAVLTAKQMGDHLRNGCEYRWPLTRSSMAGRGRGLMGNSTRSYVSPGAQKPPILKLHTD